MIKVNNITKYYGKHKAIDNLSFDLVEGKIYGLLGPNGAGKSTIMNILTGYIGATSGNVSIYGIDINDEPEKAKANIGYLPEIPPLYQDMTVTEYLKFVSELRKVSETISKNRISELIDKFNLQDVKSRLIQNLSKGYKQRVGFAGALISDPKFIVLDEPTVGLDPSQIIETREIIKSLRDEHIVLISSHILQEIAVLCDEIIFINNGNIISKEELNSLSSDEYSEKIRSLEALFIDNK